MPALDISKIQFPDPMGLREASIFLELSDMRVRTLAREGALKGLKSDDGKWSFAQKDLIAYRDTPRERKAAGPRGDGKAWIIRIKFADFEKVKAFLTPLGIKIEPRYNYAKQAEYRKARTAAQGKAKVAAATPKPAQPVQPVQPGKK